MAVNPIPDNWWLNDKDGEWTIAAQGYKVLTIVGTMFRIPEGGKYWKNTNAHLEMDTAACLMVKVDKKRRLALSRSRRPGLAARK
jgi:hypothetical protein